MRLFFKVHKSFKIQKAHDLPSDSLIKIILHVMQPGCSTLLPHPLKTLLRMTLMSFPCSTRESYNKLNKFLQAKTCRVRQLRPSCKLSLLRTRDCRVKPDNDKSQENNMNLYIIIGFVAFIVIVAICAYFWS